MDAVVVMSPFRHLVGIKQCVPLVETVAFFKMQHCLAHLVSKTRIAKISREVKRGFIGGKLGRPLLYRGQT